MNKKVNFENQQTTYDIYVANVPKHINETEFKRLFMKYGEIRQIFCRWKDDYIGYGIVKFVHKNDADHLLRETDEVYLNGQIMPIRTARRSDSSQNDGNANPNKTDKKRNQFYPLAPPLKHDMGYFHQMNYTENVFNPLQPMMMEVLCTNVENAVTFYGFPVNRTDELVHLTNALNNFAMTAWNSCRNKTEKRLYSQKVYAAVYSEDKSWYRCIIVRSTIANKPGMCTVRYIDYGNQEDIFTKNIIELPESLQNVPAFASKFYLHNLKCETQQDSKQTYLHQLSDKRMTLCAIPSASNREFQVVKCTCDGKDVIMEILKKGLAKHQIQSQPKSPKEASPKLKVTQNGPDMAPKSKNCSAPSPPVLNQNATPNANCNLKARRTTKPKETKEKNGDIIHCNGNSEKTKSDSEFHPKRIIKRGELTDVIGLKTVPSPAEVEFQESLIPPTCGDLRQSPSISMIDNVIANLKLINNVRGLVSQSTDDSVIWHAVDLLKCAISSECSDKLLVDVENSSANYKLAQQSIRHSTSSSVAALLEKRDSCKEELLNRLKECFDKFNKDIFKKKELIQKTLMDLESNSNAWMNVQLEKKPSTLEELVSEYNKIKAARWKLVDETRKKTNEKHKHAMDVFVSLKEQFALNTLDGIESTTDSNSSVCKVEKTVSYSEKWNSAISELGKVVDEEIHTLILTKDKNDVSVIQCLLDRLDVYKEKIESLCDTYQKCVSLYDDLRQIRHYMPHITELDTTRRVIQEQVSKLNEIKNSHKNKAPELYSSEVSSVIEALHRILHQEDYIMDMLSFEADLYFPEVFVNYPELHLLKYLDNKCLVKDWKTDFFISNAAEDQNIFVSKFLDNSVLLKKFLCESEDQKSALLKKAFLWNESKCDSILKIKSIFFEGSSTYVMLPYISNNLYNSPPLPTPLEGQQACRILRKILFMLKDLHALGIAHGSIHPINILVNDEKVLLDFPVDLKSHGVDTFLKGIDFLSLPNSLQSDPKMAIASDMYGFGCLVLWLLFRNMSFNSTEDKVPNLEPYRSIVEELLGPKDYALLCCLISANSEKRPTSDVLINRDFLDKYESYCCSRNEKVTVM